MTTADSTLLHHRTVFDGWRSITIGLYMALVGYGVIVGIPVYLFMYLSLKKTIPALADAS